LDFLKICQNQNVQCYQLKHLVGHFMHVTVLTIVDQTNGSTVGPN